MKKNSSYWYCPKCKEELDGCHVTYQELCEYCGTAVLSVPESISQETIEEIIKAKAEGRLVVLPCKVGDTVYEITREDCDYEDCPDEYHDRVDEVYIDQITCEIFENEVEIKLNDYLDIKDAYPTYEAAEKVIPTCNVTKLPCAGCNPVCEHRGGAEDG